MKRISALVVFLFFISSPHTWAEMCLADCNCDGQVNLTDLVQMKQEFFRNDCDPVCLPGVVGGVPKTGQTVCYDAAGNPRDCDDTGEDGEYQRGVTSPNPRFTDHGDGTVTDNLTGLIWLKNADCFGTRKWDDALSDCYGLANGSCGLNDGSVAGDWGLPNIKELQSLVDFSNYSYPLPSGHPFTNVHTFLYWSSTTYAIYTYDAWKMSMTDGDISYSRKSVYDYYVWCVRGPE